MDNWVIHGTQIERSNPGCVQLTILSLTYRLTHVGKTVTVNKLKAAILVSLSRILWGHDNIVAVQDAISPIKDVINNAIF